MNIVCNLWVLVWFVGAAFDFIQTTQSIMRHTQYKYTHSVCNYFRNIYIIPKYVTYTAGDTISRRF